MKKNAKKKRKKPEEISKKIFLLKKKREEERKKNNKVRKKGRVSKGSNRKPSLSKKTKRKISKKKEFFAKRGNFLFTKQFIQVENGRNISWRNFQKKKKSGTSIFLIFVTILALDLGDSEDPRPMSVSLRPPNKQQRMKD